MLTNSNFERTQFLLERGMDASNLRWSVISNNIANADVPGFKRSDVTFESQLQRAIESENDNRPFAATLTNKRHIPFHQPIDVQTVQPRVQLDYATNMRNDGNGVDVEYENVQAAKTQMQYQFMASMMNRNYRKISMLFR